MHFRIAHMMQCEKILLSIIFKFANLFLSNTKGTISFDCTFLDCTNAKSNVFVKENCYAGKAIW